MMPYLKLSLMTIILIQFYFENIGACTQEGLECESYETLTSGSSFLIETEKCGRKNKYPNNYYCSWYFEVSQCLPSISCSYFDVKGRKTSSGYCRGDSMSIDMEDTVDYYYDHENFCGNLGSLSYTAASDSLLYFDVHFYSNRRGKGKGFSCTVSCDGGSNTTSPPTPAPTPTPEPTPTPDCKCGQANRVQKIINGVETEANEYPWQVGIALFGDSSPSCGGSIISDTTILTAAHCVTNNVKDITVVVGDHDWAITGDGEERHEVRSKIPHPNYDAGTVDNDYALLILKQPLTFRREVRPVCLPSLSGNAYDAVTATVSGWGRTETGQMSRQLQEVDVTTMTNPQCNQNYDGDITNNMICASAPNKDSCQGDSGGPMVTLEPGNNHYALIGVVSWGYGCADPDYPGVYARVTAKQQWIEEKMEGSTCPTP